MNGWMVFPVVATMDWNRLGIDALTAVIFGVIGILLMVLGYKVFEWITPKLDVERELAENHNLAVAIVVAALLIGISIIIAHVMTG
jgi:putative membrane protein